MPSADQHQKKADRNRNFLNSISLDDHPEWVVVAAFYIAVHLVERLRAANGDGHSTSHETRLEYVQHHLPNQVHSAYHVLQNASMLARYQSVGDFFNQFQSEDVKDQIVSVRLATIEKYIEDTLEGSLGGD